LKLSQVSKFGVEKTIVCIFYLILSYWRKMRDSHLPLAGIRVVDLTSNIAAPFAGAVLGDLGADVVHIESHGGDDSRRMAPTTGNGSAYWAVVNRNKTFLRLDIRVPEERAHLEALLADADVFLTNLRPAKLEKYGLNSKSLRALHPRLIHGSLSAYGAVGEERDRAGYDAVLQSRTGIAEITGERTGQPVRAGVSILDVGAGTWLALGVVAALLNREKTGEGGEISTSLFETGANWVSYHVAAFQVTGEPSGRHGSGHPAFSPYGIFPTRTNQICLGIGGDELFVRLCNALGISELATQEKFSSNVNRVANDRELRIILEKVFSQLDAEKIVKLLDDAGVACDIVQKPEDLLNDNQASQTGVMVSAEVSGYGSLKFPGIPLNFNGKRPQVRFAIKAE
jgi:crotonobetainyl-CoA:carnitine CoA-transferase CaiB-like acyl-CoA transferase